VATLIIREGGDTPGVFNFMTTTVSRSTDNSAEDPQNITVSTLIGAGIATSNLVLNGSIPNATITGSGTLTVTNNLSATSSTYTIASTAASTAAAITSTTGLTEIKNTALYLTKVNPSVAHIVSAAAEVNLPDVLGKVVAITPNGGANPDKFYIRRTSSTYTPWDTNKTDTPWGGEVTVFVNRGADVTPVSIYYSIETDLGNPVLLTTLATGSTYTLHFYKDESGVIRLTGTPPL